MAKNKTPFSLDGFVRNSDGTYSKKSAGQPRDFKELNLGPFNDTHKHTGTAKAEVEINADGSFKYVNTSSIMQREPYKVTGHIHSISQRLEVKPLSVNSAWQGRRFKTDKYKSYEQGVLSVLHEKGLPPPPYKLFLIWGVSNKASDLDNPAKLFIDILQKKYNFNDKEIFELHVKKVLVPKRKEYCEFTLEHLND